MFVAIEGLDGSGGTTQVRLLCSALGAHETCEPSTGPIGQLIRAALADAEMLGEGVLPYLFAADRRDHLEREIEPLLAAGKSVVTDRYVASSLAYQSLAAPLEHVWQLNSAFRAPDVTVFLELSVEGCLARIDARGGVRDRFESLEKLTAIRDSYERALALLVAGGQRVVRVDAGQSVEDVYHDVLACL
ncbi:MAG TPA: dTMP kinase [Myxococcota bacterium]|nr:dTMP kinase [Myxococcota bacterium]